MKNLFKNKVFISAILLFVIIIGLFSNVFAIEFSNDNNDIINVPDYSSLLDENTVGVVITKNSSSDDIMLFIIHDIDVTKNLPFFSASNMIRCNLPRVTDSTVDKYLLLDNSWSFRGNDYSIILNNYSELYYTSINIYDSERNNVVFQPAPQVETTILAPIVEQVETNQVTAEIVGILPIILVLLVSILAIYKAIRLLRNVLKTS